jgi:hypothetical protein
MSIVCVCRKWIRVGGMQLASAKHSELQKGKCNCGDAKPKPSRSLIRRRAMPYGTHGFPL